MFSSLLISRNALLVFSIVIFCLGFPHLIIAQTPVSASLSPEGQWKTIDDKTGKEKSLVRIWRENGELKGKIEILFRAPEQPQDPICDQCTGEQHNQKIKGLTILWGMHAKDSEWTGGYILDPKNGKTYRCSLHTINDGKKLLVRGYIGVSFLGRSQTWVRVE